jgi:hypothetical protein
MDHGRGDAFEIAALRKEMLREQSLDVYETGL